MINKTYTAHILDNGLTVLLKENHSAPIISHWVWYRVGSRNEISGKTGISHFVEHMQFRGTKRFPGKEAVREITRNGGDLNAYTSLNGTAFYETMPAERIGIAFDIEADRMVNSTFDPNEVETERDVILSEQEGDESAPICRLMNTIRKSAFPHHPYGRDLFGETEDLHGLTRNDLFDYYHTWYTPNNAVVTVSGDFDTEDMPHRIDAAYGRIPDRPVPIVDIAPETPISGLRKIEAHGSSDLNNLRMVWHIPSTNDDSIPSLMLLNIILAGVDSINMFDKISISNRTSRLYRNLVNSGMASDTCIYFTPTIDPYILDLSTQINSGVEVEEVSEAIFTELEDIAQNGVQTAEIEKACKQAKAMYTYSEEDITNQAYWLGASTMFADPGWYTDYLLRLESVKTEDISQIAKSILRRDNCIAGFFTEKE